MWFETNIIYSHLLSSMTHRNMNVPNIQFQFKLKLVLVISSQTIFRER